MSRKKKRTTKLIAVFAVNGNGDHLLGSKVPSRRHSTRSRSIRSAGGLMRHNADRLVNNFFVAANGNARERAKSNNFASGRLVAPLDAAFSSNSNALPISGNTSSARFTRSRHRTGAHRPRIDCAA